MRSTNSNDVEPARELVRWCSAWPVLSGVQTWLSDTGSLPAEPASFVWGISPVLLFFSLIASSIAVSGAMGQLDRRLWPILEPIALPVSSWSLGLAFSL